MIERILVALDGSSRAPSVLVAAAEIAERFDALLIPFRAVTIPAEFPPAAHLRQGDPLPKHLDDEARSELTVLMGTLALRSEPPLIGRGEPWRAILQAAEEKDVDLIVLGSHGYKGLDIVLGTTAGRVANVARRNVLVVHDRTEAHPGAPPREPR